VSNEPVKVLPMAKLLRLAKEKEERERVQQTQTSDSTLAPVSLESPVEPPRPEFVPRVENTPRLQSTPRTETKPGVKTTPTPIQNVPAPEITPRPESTPRKGFLQLTNHYIYDLMPTLKPSDGYVLLYLIARTHGFQKTRVTVNLDTIATACHISRSQARISLRSLDGRKHIQILGMDMNNPDPTQRGLIIETLTPRVESKPRPESTPRSKYTPIKSRDYKRHTQTQSPAYTTGQNSAPHGVSVGSKFTIEECRKYADHLRSSGQGINNPGGYATTIHRTGEADALIEAYLNPVQSGQGIDSSGCPDCNGTGFYYPNGREQGVAKCPHSQLSG
jgi:hypothetical protein